MKVVVLNNRYVNGTSKKGNVLNGFWSDIAFPENGTNGFKVQPSVFLDISVLQGVVPEPGTVLDLDTGFGSTRITAARLVVDDNGTFLSAFLASFQKQMSQSSGK